MSQRRVINRPFLAAAYGSAIGQGATVVDGTNFNSLAVNLQEVYGGEVLITLEGDVENAAFNAYVDAVFKLSLDGTNYDDGSYHKLSFLFDGAASTRRRSIPLNISKAHSVKLHSIKNNDATYDLLTDSVQVYLTY